MNDFKIMFMGTPEFAELHLRSLIDAGYRVCAVVTQPDKPKGRKQVLTPPPVKVTALENGIPVYQPEKLRDGTFERILNDVNPNMIIAVAYGKILPEFALDFPKYGCINIHGSLLPKYRGAAPMQRAVIDGEKVSGVCSMYMDKGMDTGDILELASCEITQDDNFETVHDKLAQLGCETLLLTLKKAEQGTLVRTKQDDEKATIAPKIENEDCFLDFSESAECLHNRIRGLSPFPLAFCIHNDKKLKVVESSFEGDKKYDDVGRVLSLENGIIHISTARGELLIKAVLPEGKSRMKASDYINGRKIAVGDILLTPKTDS